MKNFDTHLFLFMDKPKEKIDLKKRYEAGILDGLKYLKDAVKNDITVKYERKKVTDEKMKSYGFRWLKILHCALQEVKSSKNLSNFDLFSDFQIFSFQKRCQ